jgi:hypothetical protein
MENTLIIDINTYGGQQVAIVDGRVVASGRTLEEVIKKARELYPSKPLHEIKVFAVPVTLHTIYYGSHAGLSL